MNTLDGTGVDIHPKNLKDVQKCVQFSHIITLWEFQKFRLNYFENFLMKFHENFATAKLRSNKVKF